MVGSCVERFGRQKQKGALDRNGQRRRCLGLEQVVVSNDVRQQELSNKYASAAG